MVVQHCFSFHTDLLHFESGNQALHYSYSSIHTYVYTCTSQCGSQLSLSGKVDSRVAPASSHSSGCISSLGLTRIGSVGNLTYQSMSVLLNLGKSITSRSLGVECFQPPLDTLGELCASSFSFSSPCSFQAFDGICQRSIHASYSSGNLLDEGSLASHHSQYVERHSSSVSHVKNSSWMFQ